MTLDERRQAVNRANACAKCLRRNHNVNQCKNKTIKCVKCKGGHFSIMCNKPNRTNDNRTNGNDRGLASTSNSHIAMPDSTVLGASNSKRATLLQTGYVFLVSKGRRKICRIMLDTGSQRSYISEELVRWLGSKPLRVESMSTCTIGGHISNIQNFNIHEFTLRSRFHPSGERSIKALSIKEITRSILPTVGEIPGLSPLADHIVEQVSPTIQILIGADYIRSICKQERRQ